jgi:hypothetical protein
VAASRLSADLWLAAGHQEAAAAAVEDAWHHAGNLQAPLLLAQLEITDARRPRDTGQRADGIARLVSARQRLWRLGATPHLRACDVDLAAHALRGPHAKDVISV